MRLQGADYIDVQARLDRGMQVFPESIVTAALTRSRAGRCDGAEERYGAAWIDTLDTDGGKRVGRWLQALAAVGRYDGPWCSQLKGALARLIPLGRQELEGKTTAYVRETWVSALRSACRAFAGDPKAHGDQISAACAGLQ